MLHRGKLIKGCYVDDALGMAWDLNQLLPQNYKDVGKLNEAVDQTIAHLQEDPKYQAGWLPTIGLHERKWLTWDDDWKNILQPKCHIFLYNKILLIQSDFFHIL